MSRSESHWCCIRTTTRSPLTIAGPPATWIVLWFVGVATRGIHGSAQYTCGLAGPMARALRHTAAKTLSKLRIVSLLRGQVHGMGAASGRGGGPKIRSRRLHASIKAERDPNAEQVGYSDPMDNHRLC